VQSTAKAQYVAATATANQALWLRKILTDLGMEQRKAIRLMLIIRPQLQYLTIQFSMVKQSISSLSIIFEEKFRKMTNYN
jgi:hypothetical protein